MSKEFLEGMDGKRFRRGQKYMIGPSEENEARRRQRLGDLENDAEGDEERMRKAGVEDWCRDFCESKQMLKRFVVKKEVWGWNQEGVLIGKFKSCCYSLAMYLIDSRRYAIAIKGAIRDTGYSDTLTVEVETGATEIRVHPDTRLARMMTNVSSTHLLHYLSISTYRLT